MAIMQVEAGPGKKCPFCHGESYIYRTKAGLLRHVMNEHCYDRKGHYVIPPTAKAKKIRKDTQEGSVMIEVESWDEIEDFINDYFMNFRNPSKRSTRLFEYVDGTGSGQGNGD
jgi:hypothetical protein